MQIKSNKIYIDYLDHVMSGSVNIKDTIDRLKFDLLLFSEDVLCLSVPACVKLDSTTDILMQLFPFWKNGKIKLILDEKHKTNPWNYFNNRKRVLEKGFSEEELNKHFEYIAYNSSHTDIFYNIYIKEVLQAPKKLYIGKIYDTDYVFRQSVINQINDESNIICSKLSVGDALHLGKVFNELFFIAEDRKSLFQRSLIINKLQNECNINLFEIKVICRILDRGFAYANGLSSDAAPISFITNRLTGRYFINIIKTTDKELYSMIHNLNWIATYRLSENDTWLDFIDHLNQLLLIYQEAKMNRHQVFSPILLNGSIRAFDLIKRLYETAVEAVQEELFKSGASLIDLLNIKTYSEKAIEDFVINRIDLINLIKEIDDLIAALKIVIKSLERRCKSSTIVLREQGFFINLYRE
ncbi:MAG: hypothetical protein IJU56_03915 [Clostridia bacterium]|nr:hypothetical protein [Clostridia bacterium]